MLVTGCAAGPDSRGTDTATVATAAVSTASPTTTSAVDWERWPDGRVAPPGPGDVLPADYVAPTPAVTHQAVPYGPDPREVLDVFEPAGVGPYPVLVWLHPGGWVDGTRIGIAPEIQRQLGRGWAVVSADYRLAPADPFPGAVQDAKRVVRWVKAHGSDYALDPTLVVATGASSGGYLAAMLGATPGRFEPDDLPTELQAQTSTVNAVIDLVGPVDLIAVAATGLLGQVLVTSYLGCVPDRCDPRLPLAASPLTWAAAAAAGSLPPLYLAAGAQDELVAPGANADRLAPTWQAAAPLGAVWYDEVANQGHNIDSDGLNITALDAFIDALNPPG